MPIDRERAERAVAEFLRALGHAPESDPELARTPERVTSAYADELLAGYAVDLGALVRDGSMPASGEHGIVVVDEIAIACVCPHHLLPSVGRAAVAYLPGTRLLGLGVIARIVDACARRLTLQEQIAKDVVQVLSEHAGARGAWCRTSLVHGCLSARGPCQTQASVHAVAAAGALAGAAGAAEVALALGGGGPPK